MRLFLALRRARRHALAFLGGLLVARRAMRPIAGLTRAAREVARTRDPDITLPKPLANDEVADLAYTLEDMLRELSAARGETEATLDRQREFVADASHELRTPLTSILANLELLESELDGEQREMAGSALRSSRRMRRLVGDLLLLARADAGREAPQRAGRPRRRGARGGGRGRRAVRRPPVSRRRARARSCRAAWPTTSTASPATWSRTPSSTRPPGTPVTVSVRREGDSAVLEVADRGPGVPPAHARAGLRALRARRRRRRPSGGSGLGLAIVRAVAEAHGGRVELRDAEGGGARFTVRLPAAASRSDTGR